MSTPLPETILIVDDTPANLGVLVDTLGAAGYRLSVAEDGEEALALTARTQPDLVLLDVMMPGIDGFETCRRMRAQPATADVPVLFMTALHETADKVRAFGAGGVDYITKPIEHEEALARIRTHLALRSLRRELQAQLALAENFMRIASHDLRNPLYLMMLAGELARRTPGLPEPAARHVAGMIESAAQMRRIIDTFLKIRSATGGVAQADLTPLARAALDQQAPSAERKAITLRSELAPDLPLAAVDSTHVYQAITNLLSNALKFTPPGGTVTLRSLAAGSRVRLEVADSGPGVPVAERAQLFTEGARLSPRPTGGEDSHGLGLAIVKQLLTTQGGAVGAEFPAEGGSVFWFELPAR